MKRGFYTIMSAQFFSSLADNALFVAALALLQVRGAPAWQQACLVPMFALFYVLLAPVVGAFADATPKGRVMLLSNTVKIVGCLMMLFDSHPLLSYAVVGLGAAAYSPAKYGILTELLPPSQLVKANGWIEGLTIASIVLGLLFGGQLIGPLGPWLVSLNLPGAATAEKAAILVQVLVFIVAALFNLGIPRTGAKILLFPSDLPRLFRDFYICNTRLWRDKLGQVSLLSTTLLWGISGNLRYLVVAWAAVALKMDISGATALTGVVVVGTAMGALVASVCLRLEKATRVIPLGIVMGFALIGLTVVRSLWTGIPMLLLLGAMAGFLIVPMNALLQHRGYSIMGAGRSIAVQNFNEQACILVLGFLYAAGTKAGMSAYAALTVFGLLISLTMWMVKRRLAYNWRRHPLEMERLEIVAKRTPKGH